MRRYFVLGAALTLLLAACNPAPASQADNEIKVVVSGNAVRALAAEALRGVADITMLAQPGVEAHSFEPTPQDAIAISRADFFFYTSGELEPWALQLGQGRGIALNYQLPDTSIKDPHVWMSFDNAQVMAEEIATHVARRYPELERQLAQNVAAFTQDIFILKRMFKTPLEHCLRRTVYHIGHSAFGFMAKDYNLLFRPLIGAAFEGEPAAKDMAVMIKNIKNNKEPFIFSEEALSPRVTQTITAETGAQVLYLYTIEDSTKQDYAAATTYKQFMLRNLDALIKGLGCQVE